MYIPSGRWEIPKPPGGLAWQRVTTAWKALRGPWGESPAGDATSCISKATMRRTWRNSG